VAHPDLLAVARLPDAVEQSGGLLDLDLGTAELAVVAALDLATDPLAPPYLVLASAPRFCPLCAGGVRVGAAGADAAFAQHESGGDCARARAAAARTPVCAAPRCKKKLGPGLQATCRECDKNFCRQFGMKRGEQD
jgi:hypothetical protein